LASEAHDLMLNLAPETINEAMSDVSACVVVNDTQSALPPSEDFEHGQETDRKASS
jgi:hypothetical protein